MRCVDRWCAIGVYHCLLGPNLCPLSEMFATYLRPILGKPVQSGLGSMNIPGNADTKWRRDRRAFHELFNQTAAHTHQPQYLKAARKLLTFLNDKPGEFVHYIPHTSGALIVSVLYGIETRDEDDEYVAVEEHSISGFAECVNPGAFWVDFLPFLKCQVQEKGICLQEKYYSHERDCLEQHGPGVDRVVSTLQSFVLAMAMHPEVHVSTAEDEYKGYRIPRGSVMLQNTWTILHDPAEYLDPEEFQPERFLKEGNLNPGRRDPAVAAFGSGWRPGLDEDGNPDELTTEVASGFLSHPLDFKCTILPRSKSAEAVIVF
ncbi:cytochrome P450 [Obba rivulosa]|uniref:Cytochrome P450 n=1 Tax=Obba rivulosa TaxID=1052685 RepID=A0A8E2B2Y5_9APHY|nr:cytochrome P450 [Obba rivulosa]